MNVRIDTPPPALAVGETRPRQTATPTTPFRDVLAGGVGVLLTGAEVATHVLGGPLLAVAVHEAGAGVIAGLSGGSAGNGAVNGPGSGTSAPASAGASGVPATGAGGDQGNIAAMHAMQRESQAFNLQLLGLQEEIQQENRRFTTLTNVLRARHDTAKAALSNIRS